MTRLQQFFLVLGSFVLVGCEAVRDLGDSRLDEGSTTTPVATAATSEAFAGATTTTRGTALESSETFSSDASTGADEGMPSPFTPEECTNDAIESCYSDARAVCPVMEEDICDEIFVCDRRALGCDPTDWDEYEDWEQRVLVTLDSFYPLEECRWLLRSCLAEARLYCSLIPDMCSVYVTDCRELADSCFYFNDPVEYDCGNAVAICGRIQDDSCASQPPAECDIIADTCDWVPTVCEP